ncbi:hypothetical protein [Dyella silvatica]|uniref:hypothetical protein n=1 Tax=Dyella silvatica TaxID=2992128 RepID=UPI0022502BE1|nr:hypothetical protein [Dyella silvatica]
MMRLMALLALAWVAASHAEERKQADFADYRATTHHRGIAARPLLRTAQDRLYRSRIGEAASTGRVNFAGHYILTAIGCGASCIMVFALDADTGQVDWLPFSVSQGVDDNGFDTDIPPLDFRQDSRLLIVAGSRDEHGHGLYRYVLEHDRFRLLSAREDRPSGPGE